MDGWGFRGCWCKRSENSVESHPRPRAASKLPKQPPCYTPHTSPAGTQARHRVSGALPAPRGRFSTIGDAAVALRMRGSRRNAT